MTGTAEPCLICGCQEASRLLPGPPPRHVVCRRCGFVYLTPLPSTAECEALYREHYYRGEHAPLEDARPEERSQVVVDWCTGRLSATSRVLEVGCGSGFLLEALRSAYACDVAGVELSPVACERARRSLGDRVFDGGWEDAPAGAESLDLVVMSHVLEHLDGPDAALAKVHRSLRPDGLFFVEVPNILQPNPTKRLKRWLAPEHLWYFSAARLGDLLARQGFEPIRADVGVAVRLLARKVHKAVAAAPWQGRSERGRVWRALLGHELRYWPAHAARRLRWGSS